MARIYPLEHVLAGRILLSSDGNSGRTVLRQIIFFVFLFFLPSFCYLSGVYNRLCGQSGAWLECLELCGPAAESNGTGMPGIYLTVVFTEHPSQRAGFLDAKKVKPIIGWSNAEHNRSAGIILRMGFGVKNHHTVPWHVERRGSL